VLARNTPSHIRAGRTRLLTLAKAYERPLGAARSLALAKAHERPLGEA